MEPFISVRNLKKIYTMGDEKIYALNDLSMDIYRNEIICLLGTSGSGKSTLLNMMAGLEKPTSGEVIIGGIHLEKLTEENVTHFRQLNVGFVFQSYNLIATLNAIENVSLGLIFKGVPRKQREEQAIKILKQVGLGTRLHHKPKEMSGGQQQRVSIARAFVDNPKLVFADEPTGNLDTKTSLEILDLVTGMAKEHNQTLIIVTHDEETADYADRIIHVRDGKVIDTIIRNDILNKEPTTHE
ncbi:MAG: ABC transporter ATP-binding protein [Tissierellia bacterium]|nr:ABC transporter ATP-binding protein [Tissierellia bacterium]